MKKNNSNFFVDINRDRLREIVSEAVRIMNEYIGTNKFKINEQEVIQDLNKVIDSGMVSTEFFLNLKNTEYPDLQLKINPRRRRLLCVSNKFKKKAAKINHFLKVL